MSKPVRVAVGILQREDGQILLASRPTDKPWPHWWELPGGKIEPTETPLAAVERELYEELGIRIEPQRATHWHTLTHHYPRGTVILELFIITGWAYTPQPLEGQILAWTHPDQLGSLGPILPASLPILRWLQLPQHYLISSAQDDPQQWLQRLEHTLQTAIPHMVQFREPDWQQRAHQDAQTAQELQRCFERTLALCAQYEVPCLVNSVHPQSWWHAAQGVHLRGHDAQQLQSLPDRLYTVQAHFGLPANHLIGVSAHNLAELQRAARLHADFAVLGHVLPTPSHPDHPPIGWANFAALTQAVALPVYALGGQHPDSLPTAIEHGAQGIAGIRQLLRTPD
ncbi:MAG TPA: Nudix family hydrolase [Paenalcaligenes sp.]|nr:Nudix family hydrolase [Paenalcaligenes sp.]